LPWRTFFGVTDDAYWNRLYDLLLNRVERTDDPLLACEQTYCQAVKARNVNVAVAALKVATEMIQIGVAGGADPDLLRVYDDGMAELVRHAYHPERPTFSAAEAATLLGYSERHVRRLVRGGEITGRRTPTGAWLCAAPSVLSYRKRNR
jgi:hypothetical protein